MIETELVKKSRDKKYYRRMALAVVPMALLIVYILWNVPALEFLASPLRLFVTYVHEASHSIMALITGGRVQGFLVSPDGSGVATTAGGSRALILPAGYLGAAFFGSALFYLANRFPNWSRVLAVGLGVFMLGFTLLFARPDESGAITALLLGVIFSGLLLGIGWRANTLVTLLVLDVLSVITALNAVLDLWVLIRVADTATRGTVSNDAAAFSQDITSGIIPPSVVAFIWAGLAVLMLGIGVWLSVIKPLRHEINDSYTAMTGSNA